MLTAIAGLKSKVRLLIEYGLIIVILVMAATLVTMWFQKKNMEIEIVNLGSKINTIEIINQAQDQTINNLLEYREQDASAIKQLLASNELSNRANDILTEKLISLERENESVRNFLNMPIPSELCVISRSCNPIRSEDSRSKSETSGVTN